MRECKVLHPTRQFHYQSHLPQPCKITADALLLSEAIVNVIDNAARFSAADSPVEIVCRSLPDTSQVEIAVRDHGIGMPEEAMAQLFTRFYRARHDSWHGVRGSGLGLYNTKHIIDAHGGSISATSHNGRGSTFFIRLPRN